MTHIFDKPFAAEGTTVELPVQPDLDGWVSLEEGFTADYELPYPAVPGAKPVERWEINTIFNVVTAALSELQFKGFVHWRDREWPEGSRVEHNGIIYRATATTSDEPPSAAWLADTGTDLEVLDPDNANPYKWSAEQIWSAVAAWFDTVSEATGRQVLAGATPEDIRDILNLGSASTRDVGAGLNDVLPADTSVLRLGAHTAADTLTAVEFCSVPGLKQAGVRREAGEDADLHIEQVGTGDIVLSKTPVVGSNRYQAVHTGNVLQSLGDSTLFPVSQKVISDALAGIDVATGPCGLRWNQETDVYTVLGASARDQIQSQMRRCVLNADGTVNYYLDPFDSTKKADGTPADLSGADGNVMVELPKFYYRHQLNGNVHEWWVGLEPVDGMQVHPYFLKDGVQEVPYAYYRAYEGVIQGGVLRSVSGVTPTRSTTRANFRTAARQNGAGWNIAHLHAINAVRLLYLTEYNSLNSQSKLGSGNDAGSGYGMVTGGSNVIGNMSSGPLNNNTWMSYRGIENFYADCWEFIDGFNVHNYVTHYTNVEEDFIDGKLDGSYVQGATLPAASASWIQKISGDFLPTQLGGTSATYVTDGLWSATGDRLGLHGGSARHGALVGAFALGAVDAFSGANAGVGAGLSFR